MNNQHQHHIHRHFVALPVLCAVISGFVFAHGRMFSASLLADAKQAVFATGTHQVGEGITVHIEKGTVRPDGKDIQIFGDVILSAERMGSARLSDMTATLLGGSMYIHRDQRGITLAALDVPVLLSSPRGMALIPAGYQLSVGSGSFLRQDDIAALPGYWVTEKLNDAATIPMKPVGMEGLFALPLSAQTNVETDAFLSLTDQSDAYREFAALRLLQHRQSQESMTLLVKTLNNEAIFILPWTVALGELAQNAEFALPDSFVTLWVTMSKRSIATRPVEATKKLLPLAKHTAEKFDAKGFPLYAKLWQSASTELENFARPLISKQDYRSISASEQLLTADALSQTDLPTDTLIAEAEQIFAEHELTQTVHTVCTALTAHRVHCENLFFAGSHGDSIVSLTLDLTTSAASQITVNGDSWPNTLMLPAFLEML